MAAISFVCTDSFRDSLHAWAAINNVQHRASYSKNKPPVYWKKFFILDSDYRVLLPPFLSLSASRLNILLFLPFVLLSSSTSKFALAWKEISSRSVACCWRYEHFLNLFDIRFFFQFASFLHHLLFVSFKFSFGLFASLFLFISFLLASIQFCFLFNVFSIFASLYCSNFILHHFYCLHHFSYLRHS